MVFLFVYTQLALPDCLHDQVAKSGSCVSTCSTYTLLEKCLKAIHNGGGTACIVGRKADQLLNDGRKLSSTSRCELG